MRQEVLVSFARHGRSKPQSFRRKRESTRRTFGNALFTEADSRFRGNDRRFEMGPIPNDTTTTRQDIAENRGRNRGQDAGKEPARGAYPISTVGRPSTMVPP